MLRRMKCGPGLRLVGVVAVLVVASPGSMAWAEELVFHTFEKALPLEKSPNEFAVVMNPVQAESARGAMRAIAPDCAFKPIPWADHRDECRIVETPKADLATRDRLRAVPGVVSVRPVYRIQGSDHPMLSSGNLVVRLRKDLTADERTQFFADYRVRLMSVLDGANDTYTCCPVGDPEEDEVRCSMAMHVDERTVYSHPDFAVGARLRQAFAQFDDEFLSQQWHLRNTGQDLGTVGADIEVELAWQLTFGEDVRIGIFDDAVEIDHEDLTRNYTNRGHDASTQQLGSSAPLPRILGDSHGTNVIGLAVATAGNQIGVVGVAPGSRFAASRGLSEPTITLGQMAGAFTFARQEDVDVHNNSWGLPDTSNLVAPVIVDQIAAAHRDGRGGRGMVITFASGNESRELGRDDDLSTLPTVIGVGASTGQDRLASYSNYGADIDFLAPGGGVEPPQMVTTDNSDFIAVSPGFNFDGISASGEIDLPDGQYTKRQLGTSFACPVVTGAAALVLSVHQDLTAEQVQTILEHTSEPIDALEANYHPITQRSLTHGYGRINAGIAAQLALGFRETAGGQTWPERIASVRFDSGVIQWTVGDEIREIDHDDNDDTPPLEFGDITLRTLVLESQQPYSATHFFVPQDFAVYPVGTQVAPGVTVVQFSPATTFPVESSSSKRYYALFPQNPLGLYAWGVTIDTDGLVEGTPGTGGSDGGGGLPPSTTSRPQVSISVSPLSGPSPLDVSFRGNAVSEVGVADMVWDFDDGGTSTRATTSHRYEVLGTPSRRFFPSFTVTDQNGNEGLRSVALDVTGDAQGNVVIPGLQINVSLPGVVGSNIDTGVAPFSVELTVGGDPLEGTRESVAWDLGDGGTAANTLSVLHTYENNSTTPRTLPVSVLVATRISTGAIVTQAATRFISVLPNPNPTAPGNDGGGNGGGGQPVPAPTMCGAGTTVALISLCFVGLVRRRFR